MDPGTLTCMISITPDFDGSKGQVILLFLPTKMLPSQRGHIIFIDQPFNF
jgi:hypothetical protein